MLILFFGISVVVDVQICFLYIDNRCLFMVFVFVELQIGNQYLQQLQFCCNWLVILCIVVIILIIFFRCGIRKILVICELVFFIIIDLVFGLLMVYGNLGMYDNVFFWGFQIFYEYGGQKVFWYWFVDFEFWCLILISLRLNKFLV